VSIRLSQAVPTAKAAGPAVATPAELDEALIREIANGNQLAMRTLFVRHQVRVYRFILRILRDRSLAEDVVSEVFLDVWRRADRFEGRSAVSTWLLSIARHKALTALRPQAVEQLDGEMALGIVDPALNPEAEMHEKDRGAAFRQCLSALSPEHGEIIDLVYYQEKSIKEVADILGIPLNTVKTRMFYARKRLAMLLEAAGVEHTRT
jgi:RNA polymerase sigma-70 factor (ECF subfamily)